VYDCGTTNYQELMARHLHVSHVDKSNHQTDKVDVAARHLVYDLFVAMSGTPEASRLLRDVDEKLETLARAMERGWIKVFGRQRKCGTVVRLVTLTDEGRREARKNFH
jgi:hypothetical protein